MEYKILYLESLVKKHILVLTSNFDPTKYTDKNI